MAAATVSQDDLPTTSSPPSNPPMEAAGSEIRARRGSMRMPRSASYEKRMEQFFIGSIDQGTTSSRFIIFDGTGTPVAMHQIEFSQQYPASG